MDTVNGQGVPTRPSTARPLCQLVRAAAALRWKRPDLTATLAELALDAADDAATWVTAAGWLLHGRTRARRRPDRSPATCSTVSRDGVTAGVELMAGPQGRRLRVELAGPARRSGEPAVARALLAAEPGADEPRRRASADVLTELARCAVDDAPDTADCGPGRGGAGMAGGGMRARCRLGAAAPGRPRTGGRVVRTRRRRGASPAWHA